MRVEKLVGRTVEVRGRRQSVKDIEYQTQGSILTLSYSK